MGRRIKKKKRGEGRDLPWLGSNFPVHVRLLGKKLHQNGSQKRKRLASNNWVQREKESWARGGGGGTIQARQSHSLWGVT